MLEFFKEQGVRVHWCLFFFFFEAIVLVFCPEVCSFFVTFSPFFLEWFYKQFCCCCSFFFFFFFGGGGIFTFIIFTFIGSLVFRYNFCKVLTVQSVRVPSVKFFFVSVHIETQWSEKKIYIKKHDHIR